MRCSGKTSARGLIDANFQQRRYAFSLTSGNGGFGSALHVDARELRSALGRHRGSALHVGYGPRADVSHCRAPRPGEVVQCVPRNQLTTFSIGIAGRRLLTCAPLQAAREVRPSCLSIRRSVECPRWTGTRYFILHPRHPFATRRRVSADDPPRRQVVAARARAGDRTGFPSNTTRQPLPLDFALYKASSTFAMSSLALAPCSGASATPILAPISRWWPSTCCGRLIAARRRDASLSASAALFTPA